MTLKPLEDRALACIPGDLGYASSIQKYWMNGQKEICAAAVAFLHIGMRTWERSTDVRSRRKANVSRPSYASLFILVLRFI